MQLDPQIDSTAINSYTYRNNLLNTYVFPSPLPEPGSLAKNNQTEVLTTQALTEAFKKLEDKNKVSSRENIVQDLLIYVNRLTKRVVDNTATSEDLDAIDQATRVIERLESSYVRLGTK